MKIPILINVRDYGSPAMLMVERLRQIPEARPIVVDNASTWPPLLEWFEHAPCEVIRLGENRGPRAPLTVLPQLGDFGPYYCITDPDLDISGVPLDVLAVLQGALDRYREIGKVGLSLEIDDIPNDYPFRRQVLDCERKFWAVRLDQFFTGEIDTHFCMMRTADPYTAYGPALRTDRPYTARHLPWYMTPDNITPEYRYYLDHAGFETGIVWTQLAKDRRAFA